jgi:hypothetical protein
METATREPGHDVLALGAEHRRKSDANPEAQPSYSITSYPVIMAGMTRHTTESKAERYDSSNALGPETSSSVDELPQSLTSKSEV